MRVQDIPVDELIQRINDNIDNFSFPHSRIKKVTNSDYWDELGEYLGGWELMNLIKGGIPKDAKWMMYDSEAEEIYFFSSKNAILDTIGIETIESYYEDEMMETR